MVCGAGSKGDGTTDTRLKRWFFKSTRYNCPCYTAIAMRTPSKLVGLMIALQLFFSLPAQAMDMKSYDLTSLVYLSTDIVIATLSVDKDHKFKANVTESLYGSVHPGDTLDTLTGFLTYFEPMKEGMRVILFLDRRPKKYDFIHSGLSKSPFAIPPSGVYLIDPYGHVHTYHQMRNPGPYTASGYYGNRRQTSEPTEEQDLKFPSLDEIRQNINIAIKAVAPLRVLLDSAPVVANAPALLSLADQTSPSTENCLIRNASAITEQVEQQITVLNSAELLLQAHALAGDANHYSAGTSFISPPPDVPVTSEAEAIRKEFANNRVRFLLLTFADRKRPLPLRIAALQLLIEISSYSHPYSGYATPLPIDGPALVPIADQLRKTSQSIFEDESEDSELRALAIRFLSIDQPASQTSPETLNLIRRVYNHTISNQVRYAVEDAFLTVSNELYDSLHSSTGPITSIILPQPVSGCMKVASGAMVIRSEYHERKDFPERGFTQSTIILTDVQTGKRTPIQNARLVSGFSTVSYGQSGFEISPPSDLMPGAYSLGSEYTFQGKLFSTGHTMLVNVVRSPTGQVSFQ